MERGKSNSKVNGMDFDASSIDEEADHEKPYDWLKEMQRRVKEIDERGGRWRRKLPTS